MKNKTEDKEMKMLVADIIFKDNKGVVNDCFIYHYTGNAEDKRNSMPILNRIELLQLLERKEGMFCFQNRYISGTSFMNRIEKYYIKTITLEEYEADGGVL